MNENSLQVFTYGETPIRTVEREDGETWWVLKDVCGALCIIDHKSIPRRLESDEVEQIPLVDSRGQTQSTYVINEPGLYNVILRSDKPEAKDFKRWVTHDVLPSIRAKGSYSLTQQPLTPAQLIAAQAQVLVELEGRQAQLEAAQTALAEKVDNAVKVFSRPAEDHWKADIKDLCDERHLSTIKTKGSMYEELERRANCNVNARLNNLRRRKKKTGMRHRDAMDLTKLDAVAADKQLRAIFESIVREWQARAFEQKADPTVPW